MKLTVVEQDTPKDADKPWGGTYAFYVDDEFVIGYSHYDIDGLDRGGQEHYRFFEASTLLESLTKALGIEYEIKWEDPNKPGYK